jgi:sRNA-binding carbon storage regulator CsrA
MLMLTRLHGQRVRITTPEGVVIWVTFAGIDPERGRRVRLGIEAPKDVEILREEVIGKRPKASRGDGVP